MGRPGIERKGGVMELKVFILFKDKKPWLPNNHCPECNVPVMYMTEKALMEDWKGTIKGLGLEVGPATLVWEG